MIDARRTRAAAPLEDVATQVADTRSPAPDRQHAGRELRATLRRAVATLGRRSAEMFVLRYFEELDNREIAEMYETTPGTVAVTLHRARARLMDQLQAYLGGES
jgi:RNA polymerase sigma factor (sigma-70 family)